MREWWQRHKSVGDVPPVELVSVARVEEAAVVEEILTDRRFHFELAGLAAGRDRAAVERFGL